MNADMSYKFYQFVLEHHCALHVQYQLIAKTDKDIITIYTTKVDMDAKFAENHKFIQGVGRINVVLSL